MLAKIYCPTQTAMQSGRAKTHKWILEFEHDSSRYIEGLMGWTGTKDTLPQVKLYFSSREAALNYVSKYLPIETEILEPQSENLIIKQYADNFKSSSIF